MDMDADHWSRALRSQHVRPPALHYLAPCVRLDRQLSALSNSPSAGSDFANRFARVPKLFDLVFALAFNHIEDSQQSLFFRE